MNLYDENGKRIYLYSFYTNEYVLEVFSYVEIEESTENTIKNELKEWYNWSWNKKCETGIFSIIDHIINVAAKYNLRTLDFKSIPVYDEP